MKAINISYILFMSVFLCVGAAAFADGGGNAIPLNLSWDLGLKTGFEYRFNDHMSIKADVGVPLFIFVEEDFALNQEVLGIYHFADPGDSFQYGIGLGVPVSSLVWYEDDETLEMQTALMLGLGGSFYAGYRTPSGIVYRVWLGAAYPLFCTEGEWRFEGTSFPLGLWPDFDLEVIFPLR